MNPVYLYYPNLIGYLRIFLLFLAGYLVPTNPLWAVLSYMTSMGLDAIDGTVARYFGQCMFFLITMKKSKKQTKQASISVVTPFACNNDHSLNNFLCHFIFFFVARVFVYL